MGELAEGNRDAFPPVFQLAWPLVRGYAERMLGSSADAEDAAQQAMLKLFSRAHEFRSGAAALPWILGIVTYECRTHRKKVARRRENLADPADGSFSRMEDPRAGPEERALHRDEIEAVSGILARLTDSEREAVLSAILETERPQLAAAAFRKRLQRGMGKFRLLWRTEHGE
jgi:RNA polymerase sigma-70 factor, ECF subfamily